MTRKELLIRGATALVGTTIASSLSGAAPARLTDGPWRERRKQVERDWLDILGDFPKEVPPLRPIVKEVARENGLTRYHVSFQAEPDDRVTAWLLVPDSARRKPAPAMICSHSTTFGAGKDQVIGICGKRRVDPPDTWNGGRSYGLHLANYGYVTLSIDLLTDGERVEPGARVHDSRPFYRRHPDWSIVGKNTWDIMRSVDFLETLDYVKKASIGCVGLSLGGHTSLFAGAFEPRMAATISVGGVLDWGRNRNLVPGQERFAVDHWARRDEASAHPELERRFGFKPDHGPYIYIRKYREYLANPKLELKPDFDGLMALVAPRPLLILSSEQEFFRHRVLPKCRRALEVYLNWQEGDSPPSAVESRKTRDGFDETMEYYGFNYGMTADQMGQMLTGLGAGDCFSWFSFPGGHNYPPLARRHSFAWLDRWLGHIPPNHDKV